MVNVQWISDFTCGKTTDGSFNLNLALSIAPNGTHVRVYSSFENFSKLMILKLWLDAQNFGLQFAKSFMWQYLGLGDYDNMLGNISIQLNLFWQSTSTSIQHYVLLIL